jgi:hypothetical protein
LRPVSQATGLNQPPADGEDGRPQPLPSPPRPLPSLWVIRA